LGSTKKEKELHRDKIISMDLDQSSLMKNIFFDLLIADLYFFGFEFGFGFRFYSDN